MYEISNLTTGTKFGEHYRDESYDKLVVLTTIQLYGKEWILVDSSSLTIPKTILKLGHTNEFKKVISLDYVIKDLPDFEYELN